METDFIESFLTLLNGSLSKITEYKYIAGQAGNIAFVSMTSGFFLSPSVEVLCESTN